MPNEVRIQLTVDEDLSGLAKARSALDDFKRELKAGTVAGSQHAAMLKLVQERQKLLARDAKSTQQTFRAARQDLQSYLGAFAGVLGMTSLGSASAGWGMAGGGMISSHNAPTLSSTLGLPSARMGTVLRDVFRHGVGPVSGPSLAAAGLTIGSMTVGSQNRAVSALGGAASGAMIGTSIMPGIGTAVGAAIGGIVGLVTGGSGRAKTYDAAIADKGFAELRQILDDYYHLRRNYTSTIDAAFRIWQQMQRQWVRRQSALTQQPYFDQILAAIQQTEDERNRRRQLQSLLPVPEFASGGLVGQAFSPSRNSGMLAVVHPGEFVMTRQAVERIGASALEGLNQGSAITSASGMQLSLEPATAQTLAEMLKSNPQALEQGLLMVLRRGGTASRLLRA